MATKSKIPGWLTVKEIARIIKRSPQRVHQLIETYGLEARNIGRVTVVSRSDAARIMRKRPAGVHISRQASYNRRRGVR